MQVSGSALNLYAVQPAGSERRVPEISRARREDPLNESAAPAGNTSEDAAGENTGALLPRSQRVNEASEGESSRFERLRNDDLNPRERRAIESYFAVESNTVEPPGQSVLARLDLFV